VAPKGGAAVDRFLFSNTEKPNKIIAEKRGRWGFDTAIEYSTVTMMAADKTRTRQPTGGPRYRLFLV
jgi:hypothetical protein